MRPVLRSELEDFAKTLTHRDCTIAVNYSDNDGWSIVWTDVLGKVASIQFYIDGDTIVWPLFESRPDAQDQGLFQTIMDKFPAWGFAVGITRTAVPAKVSPKLEWVLRTYGYDDDPTGEYYMVADPVDIQATADWMSGTGPEPAHVASVPSVPPDSLAHR